MTTAAIMQPTYLPYLGYFRLISCADVFVFLDDVQFARRSWQSRNRILTRDGELMLTVPTRKAEREAVIRDIEIADDPLWREKHLASIRHTYRTRPAFADGFAFLTEQIAGGPGQKLADLNCTLIEAAARNLGYTARFVRAGDLACPGARSEHLLAICRAVGADRYLSPMGSHDYMEEEQVFAEAGFPVTFQTFVPIPYPQVRPGFTPYMAFVDSLMNIGWTGMRWILDEMNRAAP